MTKIRFRLLLLTVLGLMVAACDREARVAATPGSGVGEKTVETSVPAAAPQVAALAPISFNHEIQPILSEYCYACHGPDAKTRYPESEPLRLDNADSALAVRESGEPVIIPGNAAGSLAVKLIRSQDKDLVMPPPDSHKTLDAGQIEKLVRWIDEGANFEPHWAFRAPVRAALPKVADPAVGENPIDHFIAAELSAQGLALGAEDSPSQLLRRAALDLTGLLPSPEQVAAFVADPSETHYRAVIEEMLDSDAYAEHRARYWLDYARYADTHGLHFDNYRSIWPYRDYVIRSFRSGKPYDQFVREQVAGDQIPADDADPLIATGYLRCAVTTNEGGTIAEEVETNLARDRTEAFGATFLGLTVGCAACHDHKFDPTLQRDFYALTAFLSNTTDAAWDFNIADPQPVLRVPVDVDGKTALDAKVAELSKIGQQLTAIEDSAQAEFQKWLAEGNHPETISTDGLELRLRFDEGAGDQVVNSAAGDGQQQFSVLTNPLVWRESVWLWPSARMDISSNLPIPDQADFEADEPFSVGTWARVRVQPGGSTTGDGAFLAKMGSMQDDQHRGWDMYLENDKLIVHLVQSWPEKAIRVEAQGVPRGEWVHLGMSYDGSGKAAGVTLFINGERRDALIDNDSLEHGGSIRNQLPLQIGSRHTTQPLREIMLQDLRIYRRGLSADEFARMPFEDRAAEILAAKPDASGWNARDRFVVLERFFLGHEHPEAARLRGEQGQLRDQIEQLTKDAPVTLVAREREQPAHAWVLDRGVYSAREELLDPAVPSFLPQLPVDSRASRLDLANWLFTPEQPLFARVTVNRMWAEVFGTGLVETPDDFGIMGARPSHPELLDWLAVEFRESGWDGRHMYRLMLTSRAYRQSQVVTPAALETDPDNRLLSRAPRFRMDGEMLRDTALQVSGLLVERIGGPSVKPYQPTGLWSAVSMPESNTKEYVADTGANLYRRSLYTFWKRFSAPATLETFDAQSREVVCVKRARTNTPLQALVSMNDTQFVEAARKLAERLLTAPDAASVGDDELVRRLSMIVVSRPQTPRELAMVIGKLAEYRAYFSTREADAAALLATGESPADSALAAAELAAWTMLANQFLNLDEVLVK